MKPESLPNQAALTRPRRCGSSEMPQRTSPRTPQSARRLKMTGSEPDSASSSHAVTRKSTEKSPKVLERRSPNSPVLEKKRPSKVTELEAQLAKVQEDLKKAKDQLTSSESFKTRAQQEAEEAKNHLLAITTKLENSERQLAELSAADEDRLQEPHKVLQDRDQEWESELEALKKLHSADSAALASAMNEIQRLKRVEIENAELQDLRLELDETLSLVENMKSQISECKESEARSQAIVDETSMQLEMARTTIEMLNSDGLKSMEALSSVNIELEESRAHVNSLEKIVKNLQSDQTNKLHTICEPDQLITELSSVKSEVEELRVALEEAEIKYHEEQIKNMIQTQFAYELVELTKSESSQREAELKAELKQTKEDIIEMKADLMDKETALQGLLAENEGLNLEMEKSKSSAKEFGLEEELKNLRSSVSDLKANLMDKETELQNISEENEMLKSEMEKREVHSGKGNAEAETARAVEREAVMRLGFVTEEADKTNQRAARVAEQLEAAQVANLEMKAELRRLRVQTDQWRKAAEAAAAVLSNGNNGKFMDRSLSLDGEYHHPITGKMMSSPYPEDMDDDSPKKKNNVLKRIGVLWKKNQK
ncbi:interactor of constitutive active ROPs 2, chloroplastic-like isoform X2 [Tasmannia lanceolata]|uniref:interactor of constitutive active ROPs 2, chloroplastic-like isoform X2 n=1 Tax=Tasmannia lanceolata TaxID=3420 RepID=UPI004064925C